jgi:hypothetical protein
MSPASAARSGFAARGSLTPRTARIAMTTRRRGWRAWLAAAVSGRAGRIGNAGARPLPPMSVMGQPRRAGRLKPPWRRREGRLHPVCTASTRRLLAAPATKEDGPERPRTGPRTDREAADRDDTPAHRRGPRRSRVPPDRGRRPGVVVPGHPHEGQGGRCPDRGSLHPAGVSPPRQVSGRRSAWQASLLRRPGPGG